MLDVPPGKEEEFRSLQRWLAVSDRLDRLIEAAGPADEPQPLSAPVPFRPAAEPAGSSRGLRAGFAARLARLALAVHREAAAEIARQPRTESSSEACGLRDHA